MATVCSLVKGMAALGAVRISMFPPIFHANDTGTYVSDIVITRHPRPVFRQHFACVRVYLTLPRALEAGAFEAKVEPTNAREQAAKLHRTLSSIQCCRLRTLGSRARASSINAATSASLSQRFGRHPCGHLIAKLGSSFTGAPRARAPWA